MRVDPYAQYNFLVEIDGLSEAVAGFTEVTGLVAESDAIEYREGSETATVRKLPGLRKYNNISLKRGITANRELWDWRKTTLDGVTERKSGAIILMDEARNPALRWEFSEAWVMKYEGPTMNSTANETAIETVELAVEDLRLA